MRLPRAPRVRIKVTEEIIKDSVKANSSHCMIAEALKRAIPKAFSVSVDMASIRFSDREARLRYIYMTPRIAQFPIVEFDQGKEPEPFEFMLTQGHVTRIGGSRAFSAKGSPGQIKRAREIHKALAKSQLVRGNSGTGNVPERIGGQAPPTSSFAKRRAFGLRLLGRAPVESAE